MDYKAILKNSPLGFSLIEASSQIIAEWMNAVKVKYQLPTLHGIQIDAQQVEDDVAASLSSAIDSLVSSTEAAKKSTPGWSYGYLCGHVQGRLNVTWTHRYLITASMEFEDLLRLKAITESLKLDQIWQPIAKIYEYVLRHKEQWIEHDANRVASNSWIQSENDEFTKSHIRRDEFVGYLNHLLLTQHASLALNFKFQCCPDLDQYLDQAALIKLVGVEHFT